MINATRADSNGVKDGKLIIRFLGDDQKRYDIALAPRAVSEALVALLQGATSLPRNNQATVEGTLFQGSAQLAVGPQMQPVLVLGIGGVEIPTLLSEPQLASLRDDISNLLGSSAKKH